MSDVTTWRMGQYEKRADGADARLQRVEALLADIRLGAGPADRSRLAHWTLPADRASAIHRPKSSKIGHGERRRYIQPTMQPTNATSIS
jgi:hypothetical protein